MNEVDWIKSLDHAPGDAKAVDVAAAVMLRVRSTRPRDDVVFSRAALAAVVVGFFAIAQAGPVWNASRDPLAGFAEAFDLVLQ